MKFTLLLTSVISALSLLPGTHAWGKDGHAIVATIAEAYLDPNVLPALCSLIDQGGKSCSLASVASWADQIKNKMRWSSTLHYVNSVTDHPPQLCNFPGNKGWEGRQDANVLAAIRNTTNLVTQWAQEGGDPSDPLASEALKFLIHFVGDVQQPFHLVAREKGGNGVRVYWGKKKVNLHSLWDTSLVERAAENTDSKWDKPVSSKIEKHLHGGKYDPLIRKVLVQGIQQEWASEYKKWTQCPAKISSSTGGDQTVMQALWDPSETDDSHVCPWSWAFPIHKMACDWAWPKELDQPPYNEQGGPLLQLDTDEYAGKIADEWVIEKLLTMGGLRLAHILNQAFAQ